jgi:hypothetical protein
MLQFIELIPTNLQPAFEAKVRQISQNLGVQPNWLMAIMHLESKLNAQAKNPNSSATGLIQFMAATAIDLGTSTATLFKLNELEQLPWVEKYFKKAIGLKPKPTSFVDLYVLVLHQVSYKYSYDAPLPFNAAQKKANPAFVDDKGNVTKRKIMSVFKKRYPFLTETDSEINSAIEKKNLTHKIRIALLILVIASLIAVYFYKKQILKLL